MKKLLKVFISTLLCVTACTAACCLGGCADGVDTHRHKPTKVAAKAPTCTEDGNNEYYVCKDCRLVFSDSACTQKTTVSAEKLPATGHVYDQSVWGYIGSDGHAHICACGEKEELFAHFSSAPATFTQAETCIDCGYEIAPALSHTHTPILVEAKAPTCTEDGNNAYYTCGGCNLVFADGACLFVTTVEAQTLPKTQHTYDQSAWGYIGSDGHAHTCVCGDKEGIIPHASSAPATEDSPETCTACGYEMSPVISHQHQALPDDGDCTTPIKCSCGHVMTDGNTAHSFDHACDTTCNTAGCNFERAPAPHVDANNNGECDNCHADTTNGDTDINLPEDEFGN